MLLAEIFFHIASQSTRNNILWKRLSAGTVPVNKKRLIGTIPANKEHLTGTVIVNKEHLTGKLYIFWGNEGEMLIAIS